MENPVDIILQTYEEQLARIRTALTDRPPARVAKATGLHENTVRSIASGANKMPSIQTVQKLVDYLFSTSL